ncbi:MAG: hypothetical protein ACRDF4_04445 [Rhabdochlamydiaceae bacterium]
MPKWKEGATEFTVGVNFNEKRGYACAIPKPIIETLGKPDRVTFSIKGRGKVEIEAAKEEKP